LQRGLSVIAELLVSNVCRNKLKMVNHEQFYVVNYFGSFVLFLHLTFFFGRLSPKSHISYLGVVFILMSCLLCSAISPR